MTRPIPPRHILESALRNFTTVTACARVLEVSRPTVRQWMRLYGIEVKGGARPKPVPPREVIEAALREHGGLSYAAAALHVAHVTLKKWMIYHGIPVAKRGRKRGFVASRRKLPFDNVLIGLLKRLTHNQIAQMYGVSHQAVSQHAKRTGVKRQ